jgi:hypothetical protein
MLGGGSQFDPYGDNDITKRRKMTIPFVSTIPKTNYKGRLIEIYKKLDEVFSKFSINASVEKGGLLKTTGIGLMDNIIIINTPFKNVLKNFLRDITLGKCPKTIDNIFDNNSKGVTPFITFYHCRKYDNILKLYNYLNDIQYKNDETTINNLKEKLRQSLIDICIDNNIKSIIESTSTEVPTEAPPIEVPTEAPPIEVPTEAPSTEVPAEAPSTEVKEKYMKYEEYDKGSSEEKKNNFNLLSPIFKLFATYKKFYGYYTLLNIVDNNLIYIVNEVILNRYEKITGTVFEHTTASSMSTKPENQYDDLDILIKKIYVDKDPEYTKYTDYLRKKIENKIAIVKIKDKINNKISELQKSLDAYNEDISKLDNLLSENHKYIEDNTPPQLGGNTKITKLTKKDILGKSRCIYKKSGDRKQYIKHKGVLITVNEYKKIMTTKNK